MHLANFLKEEQLLLNVPVHDRFQLIRRMTDAIFTEPFKRRNPHLDIDQAVWAVFERESQRPTALGHGLALPHARIENFDGFAVALATVDGSADWAAPDGDPVRLVCLVLSSAKTPTVSLKILGALSGFFRKPENRATLLSMTDPAACLRFLMSMDLAVDVPIYARDIMNASGVSVGEETPIKEVTMLMHAQRAAVIPVVDAHGIVKGEITCNLLFRYGLPDFFTRLKSVAFIDEYDPFEKYFAAEHQLMARDVMSSTPVLRTPETTLMEIVFDLAVRQAPQIYVVDEAGHWLGTIDATTILDNVIHF